MLFEDGEMLPIMKVKVLAVRESWSKRVSFDYRNGGIFLAPPDRLYITLPKVVKDWFIFLSYLKC